MVMVEPFLLAELLSWQGRDDRTAGTQPLDQVAAQPPGDPGERQTREAADERGRTGYPW
jgi:hypothetical protein